jgi:hypothetical protein
MYARALEHAGEATRRFTISGADAGGWDVKEERGSQVVRSVHYTDWHRVERARMAFAREVQTLQQAGWRVTAA